jgi:hypothetical protein
VVRNLIGAVQLVYCRDPADVVRLSGNLGRFLLRGGIAVAVIDANDRLNGVACVFVADRAPRYFRGAAPPAVGDLSDTEMALFGL